ncbi:hypothetical protein JCM24511_08672 [Saitozyma sp. JCM 24511]|nr:hypothetical protein JCM24511_08672 [Saitozyma sp. JCM 24511]
MSVIRPFDPTDILRFNKVNQDPWTATYHNGYYCSYAAQWPDFCYTAESPCDGGIDAYMIAKHEPPAPDPQHHGHLTALSISPPSRGLGLARIFMALLEQLSGPGKDCVDAWFVDLFVRCNNTRAVSMYEKMGYSVFRRVVE